MYDAILLAGGEARRLGGADKPALDVGGRTLLDHALDAVADAGRVVVVGPRRPTSRPVTWCLEDPPGGGPVAALAAALPHVSAGVLVVLAADLPRIAPAVPLLLAALADTSVDVALLVDPSGRLNYLAGAWRRRALEAELDEASEVRGASMRRVISTMNAVPVPDTDGWGTDCDTWDDVERARARARAGGPVPRPRRG